MKLPIRNQIQNQIQKQIQKQILKPLALASLLSLSACETMVDQYGQTKQVMSPTGAALLNTAVATGVGAASGSLLKNQPGWMNGMISSLSGSVASQLVNSVANQGSTSRYSPRPNYNTQNYQSPQNPQNYYPQPMSQPMSQPMQRVNYQTYGNQNYPSSPGGGQNQEVLYTRLPNGQFVPINP